jgi:hypothetical protein
MGESNAEEDAARTDSSAGKRNQICPVSVFHIVMSMLSKRQKGQEK